MVVSKTALGLAVGICGTILVGYCVYFDRKRRNDPNFKKKLRERRKANKATKSAEKVTKFPDLTDREAVHSFFLHEVQLGEELYEQGDIDGGVDHLSNAVAVCGQPNDLLRIFQQTLPPHIYQLLLQKLSFLSQRIRLSPSGPVMEEDVE